MPPRITSREYPLGPTFIRQWRQRRRLSQDQLVKLVREHVETFSKSTLSRLENGKQAYTQPVLEALAGALNCQPWDLLMREPDNDVWAIMDTLQKLKKPEQQQIARIVNTFSKPLI